MFDLNQNIAVAELQEAIEKFPNHEMERSGNRLAAALGNSGEYVLRVGGFSNDLPSDFDERKAVLEQHLNVITSKLNTIGAQVHKVRFVDAGPRPLGGNPFQHEISFKVPDKKIQQSLDQMIKAESLTKH